MFIAQAPAATKTRAEPVGMMRSVARMLPFSTLVLALVVGCASYGNVVTTKVPIAGGFVEYHVMPRSDHPKAAVIFLNGSSVSSALGEKRFGVWTTLTFAHYFDEDLPRCFELMVPEVRNVEYGDRPRTEPEVLQYYTLSGRVEAAASSIDHYLTAASAHLGSVFIIGHSEGALILPRVYHALKQRTLVSKLVAMSYGGMSQYEGMRVLRDHHPDLPPPQAALLADLDDSIKRISLAPESISLGWLGWPYRRWADFGPYRPLDDLLTIDIPILMIHGSRDFASPVESSRLVAQEFQKKGKPNLDYREYPNYDHAYNGNFRRIVADITGWLESNNAESQARSVAHNAGP